MTNYLANMSKVQESRVVAIDLEENYSFDLVKLAIDRYMKEDFEILGGWILTPDDQYGLVCLVLRDSDVLMKYGWAQGENWNDGGRVRFVGGLRELLKADLLVPPWFSDGSMGEFCRKLKQGILKRREEAFAAGVVEGKADVYEKFGFEGDWEKIA